MPWCSSSLSRFQTTVMLLKEWRKRRSRAKCAPWPTRGVVDHPLERPQDRGVHDDGLSSLVRENVRVDSSQWLGVNNMITARDLKENRPGPPYIFISSPKLAGKHAGRERAFCHRRDFAAARATSERKPDHFENTPQNCGCHLLSTQSGSASGVLICVLRGIGCCLVHGFAADLARHAPCALRRAGLGPADGQ